MSDNFFCILLQDRQDSDFKNFIGKYYHFHKKYLSLLSKQNVEFVYYEQNKDSEGVYFGAGKILKVFDDKKSKDYFFAEIGDFKKFSKVLSFSNYKSLQGGQKAKPGNEVISITEDEFEGICLDGGIQLSFKADVHLIKVLGEQLIGSEKVGILELIKNAIDANAGYCRVVIENVKDLPSIDSSSYSFNNYPGTVIVIEDDGYGMTREIIEDGWLRPASTLKTSVKDKLREERSKAEKSGKLGSYNSLIKELKKEHNGRIPLGEKGVGRFATHRLGKNLILRTKTKDSEFENVLRINWDAFDLSEGNKVDLDSIAIQLTRERPIRKYGKSKSGTQLIIYGEREGFTWDEKKINDINKSILRLNSPNPNPKKIQSTFKAYLECPQIEHLERTEVHERFSPNFTLDALVDRNGVVEEYTLKFLPPKSVPLPPETWSDKNFDLKLASPYWRDSNGNIRNPICGSFFIHLDAWYRKKPWIDGPDVNEMTDYLDQYGGISIYRDDIIIFPAESGTKNDWLDLSKRHIKQGFRISYYNLIGNVEIEQTENLDLIDKTNREGMIENTAFQDLSMLTETIVQNILESRYIKKRDEHTDLTKGIIRDPKKLTEITEQSAVIIGGINDNYPIEADPWKILHQLGDTVSERKTGLINLDSSIRNLKKSIEIIEDVQERLSEHAGFGIAAAVSLHELTKITTNFYNGISQLIKIGKYDGVKLEDLKEASSSLKSELKRLSPLRAIRNENRREFNIAQSVKYCHQLFKLKMEKEKIEFEFNISEDFTVYARYAALNQVIANLFDNSLYWILMAGNKKKRKIQVDLNKQHRTLVFADTGVGINSAIRPYLFEAGYSMKIPPSGLGLYICKSYMHSMNGDIHETISREKIKNIDGAQFTIEFETVPKSKELVQ